VEQQLLHDARELKILRILTDVWLPDFKFGPGRCAMTLAKTPWYWETVTRNITLLDDWGEDFSVRHLVMPNHVECCTYPVLEWIASRVPAAPVNVMEQFHPDNFCDPASAKYRDKYAEIARQPTRAELEGSWRRARELGLRFEAASFDRHHAFGMWMPTAVRMVFGPNKIGKLSANLAKLRWLRSCNCLARKPQTLSEKSTTYAG
jgi:putative pyruvate formate lyase activating enzyme